MQEASGVAALRRFTKNRPAAISLCVVSGLIFMAAIAPVIDRNDPSVQHLDSTQASPSGQFWLGTDQLGRDYWSRLLHGARISLTIGILTQLAAVGIGIAVGTAAGLGNRDLG